MMRWRLIRDAVLFTLAVAGLSAETTVWVLSGRPPDPTLTAAFVGLLGAPLVIRRDEKQGDQE